MKVKLRGKEIRLHKENGDTYLTFDTDADIAKLINKNIRKKRRRC